MKIFGYDWEDIKQAQQGQALGKPVVGRSASVKCFRCEKYFPLPDMKSDEDPFPVQCSHCGYMHTFSNAKEAQWPI